MTTQLMVKIDRGLKQRVAKKAKTQDLSLTDLVKMTFRAYEQGRIEPSMIQVPERFNSKTRKEIEKALKDIKARKNLAGPFNSAKALDDYLDSL